MQKHIYLAKQGLFFKIISVFLQNIIILPVSFLLSFFITSFVISFLNVDSVAVFIIILLFLNAVWIVRNSIVKVKNGTIIVRNFIGTKQIIEIDCISDLKLINYKELRNIIFNTKAIDPLITNCAEFLIPMDNFISFKNKYGRTVTIGVWNYHDLYSILKERNLLNPDESITDASEKPSLISSEKIFKCFIKMPVSCHISTYFKCFYSTIILPLFIALLIPWVLSLANVSLNPLIWILLFAAISIIRYIDCIKIVADENSKTIKLNLFNNNNKNVIKYKGIVDLYDSVSKSQIDDLKKDKSKTVICTPYYKNQNVIGISLQNNIYVFLSVNKPHDLYAILENSISNKTDS